MIDTDCSTYLLQPMGPAAWRFPNDHPPLSHGMSVTRDMRPAVVKSGKGAVSLARLPNHSPNLLMAINMHGVLFHALII